MANTDRGARENTLTRFTLNIDETLNSSDRLILGEIIIREIRRRTRAGTSYTGGKFDDYSTSYSNLITRRGLSNNVDLDRSGDMLASLRILRHGPGFIIIGISGMDRAAFAKARYTQGDGRAPARLWLGISNTFATAVESRVRRAGSVETVDEFTAGPGDNRSITREDTVFEDIPLDEQITISAESQVNVRIRPLTLRGPNLVDRTDRPFTTRELTDLRNASNLTIDISASADRTTAGRLLGESPNRAGITARSRLELVRNRLEVSGLSTADRRVLERERRRAERFQRLDDLDSLGIEALRFVRESNTITSQLPTFGNSLDGRVTGSSISSPINRRQPDVQAIITDVQSGSVAAAAEAEIRIARIDQERQRAQDLQDISNYGGAFAPATPAGPTGRDQRRFEVGLLNSTDLSRFAESQRPQNSSGFTATRIDFRDLNRTLLPVQSGAGFQRNIDTLSTQSAQQSIDRFNNTVRADSESRNNTSLNVIRFREERENLMRNALVRRFQTDALRIEGDRLRAISTGIKQIGRTSAEIEAENATLRILGNFQEQPRRSVDADGNTIPLDSRNPFNLNAFGIQFGSSLSEEEQRTRLGNFLRRTGRGNR